MADSLSYGSFWDSSVYESDSDDDSRKLLKELLCKDFLLILTFCVGFTGIALFFIADESGWNYAYGPNL